MDFECVLNHYNSQSTPVIPTVSRRPSRNSNSLKRTSNNQNILQSPSTNFPSDSIQNSHNQYQSKSKPTSPNISHRTSKTQNLSTSITLNPQPLHNPNIMSFRSSNNQHADIPLHPINNPRPSKNSAISPQNSTCANGSLYVIKIAPSEAPKPNMYLHNTNSTELHLTNKLIKSIRTNNKPAMTKLLSMMPLAQVNHGHIMGDAALHEACVADNEGAVAALLAVPGIQLSSRDNFGYSPVMLAAYCCSNKALAALLSDREVDLDLLNMRNETLEQMAGGRPGTAKTRRQDTIDLIRMERNNREILQRQARVDNREHLSGGYINKTVGHINQAWEHVIQTVGHIN